MEAVTEEIEEDVTLFANPAAQVWLINFAKLLEWTATGDNSILPAELLPVAEKIESRRSLASAYQ
jgi:hypothetical protein